MILMNYENRFSLTNLAIWGKYPQAKAYIQEDVRLGTCEVIPALNNLKKRFSILITLILHAYYGFKSVIAQDFILELPKDFSQLLSLAYWQDFQIKLANKVFDVGLQNSENLYLKYLGEGEDYESEPLQDMKEILFETKDPETKEDIEGFWND